MGGMIELAQAYLTTCRSGEWLDLLANSIGVVIGNTAYFIVIGLRSKIRGQKI
jgi:VanZ family protein